MRYSAFISYNHRDRRWAAWVHRALERYTVPKRLHGTPSALGPLGARLPPLFRDREELATSADLGEAVRAALAEAATLIVICSRNAVQSRWVNEEIRTFIALGRRDRIRCLIVDGEPHSRDPALECLPPALFEQGGNEPLAADIRPGQDSRSTAKLKLIAGILDISFDELRRREAARRQKRLAIIAAASFIGFVAMSVLAFVAIQQRNLAQQRTMTAERTVSFVKAMFEVSDPSEARGAEVTAREILDRGVRDIKAGLADEPAVQAELGATLSEVYGSLGLFKQSGELAAWSLTIPHADDDIRARQLLIMGEAQARLGNYERALSIYAQALPLAHSDRTMREDLMPRILVRQGESASALGNTQSAISAITEALRLDRARLGENSRDVARDLEALGLAHYDAGDLERAKPFISKALAIRRKVEGAMSPSVSDNITVLANIAYLRGDSENAERLYRSRLAIDQKVLGPDHPDVAGLLNSIGRIMIERRAYAGAAKLLDRAMTINLAQRSQMHDDMAFIFSNLALARYGLGQMNEAERLFVLAMATAEKNKHRTLGPIMTDLALLRCRDGRAADGLALAERARPIMMSDYEGDAWRLAWTENVRGQCLARLAQAARAASLIAASWPILIDRWPAGSHFRSEAARPQMDNAS